MTWETSGVIDASIVTTHMMLEATTLGVGTTWVMYFIPEAVREEFAIPDNIEPVALLVMGYPAPAAKPFPGHSEFKPIEDVVSYNKF
ncbi:nitroreductase family protein [Dehalobacter sp. TBBPA1]|uniref:nitroreductase family protein n=1 Tax=Dehalobacter sp. TBBPA1 TaxID=3235037 RepID=UPI0034A125AD